MKKILRIIFILYLLNILIIYFSCNKSQQNNIFWSENNSPDTIGNKKINEVLSRNEFIMYISDHCNSVHDAITLAGFGATRLAGLLKDTSTIVFSLENKPCFTLSRSVVRRQSKDSFCIILPK